MRTIDTSKIELGQFKGDVENWVYNGFDCSITQEVFEEMYPQLDNHTSGSYSFIKEIQAPLLEIMLRGIAIDGHQRDLFVRKLSARHERVYNILNQLCYAVWDKGVNINSPKQLQELLYGACGLPKQFKFEKGVRKVSTDRAALEALLPYLYTRPIINCILALRDITKQLSVLRSGIDHDGRMRATFKPGGTETARLSSSKNVWGGGMNFQNVTNELRRIFISDPGMKMAYLDLEQAESRVVAYLSGDENYINACESGDLHTEVCRLVWPELPWTGELSKDKAIAESPYYRHFSYRDMAKRGGHASNYNATAWTVAKHLKISVDVAEEFQNKYFGAFPGIRHWHQKVARIIQTEGELITAFGRKCKVLKRTRDDATLREMIAYDPQSTIGELLNAGMLNQWWNCSDITQLLAQVHDAVLFQYPEEEEDSILARVKPQFEIPLEIGGRKMIIPTEVSVGWNWAKQDPDCELFEDGNPDGLIKWKGHDERQRSAQVSVLDRRFHAIHGDGQLA